MSLGRVLGFLVMFPIAFWPRAAMLFARGVRSSRRFTRNKLLKPVMKQAPRRQVAGSVLFYTLGGAVLLFLLAISYHRFFPPRARISIANCISNMKHLSGAKELWAVENRKTNGTPCSMTNLVPAYLKIEPKCTLGNHPYLVNPIGSNPVCPYYDPKMKNPHEHSLRDHELFP